MSQANLYCNHFNNFTDQEFQELFSEVAAIRAENKELFEFTHRPIEVFPSAEAGQDNPQTVSESEVLKNLRADRNRNYAVVIEGETGTGKSELCAYLVHQLRDQGRPILRVDKDDDLLSILTKRLPEFYHEHFDEKLPQAGAFERLEENIKTNPQTVANHATTGALLKFSKNDISTDYTREDEAVIAEVVEDQLGDLVSSGEYGKERNLISRQQYERESAFHVFEDSVSVEEAIDQWNTQLWNVIRDEYDTPPLSEMLAMVGERFTDTRPVVVFEDFSIAALEAKQLCNYIERDKKGDQWDFVIAGTRDVTEVMHTQTAEDRFEYYQTNKPNSNSVLFLNEESSVEFIRPYLAYFKTQDGSVSYAKKADGERGFSSLQAAPSGSICDECALCDESFRDLFPFNQTFLRRIYTGLDESEQSPREYVSKVYEVLEEYYLGGTAVPSSASALGSDVTNRETPDDEVYDQREDFADLAKWYGTKEGSEYVVDRAFATAFDLISPDRQPGELDAGIIVEDTKVRIPAAGGDIAKSGGSSPDVGGKSGKTKVEQIYDERVGDVDDWIDDPANARFSETNSYIKTALTDLIEHVTDDYTIWTDGSLRYNLSSQKAPFVYGASAENLGDDQVILDTEEFRPSEVRSLLEYGIRIEEDPETADREQELERSGTHITHYASHWRQQILDQFIDTNTILYRKVDRGRFDFDDFVLATYALITLLDDPWHEVTAERLNKRYRSDEEYTIDNAVNGQLQQAAPRDDYAKIQELFTHADNIEKLVESRFGVVADTLDVPRLRRRLQQATPSRILSALAQKYINNISGRVRFGPSETLPDIATAAYRTQDALTELYEDLSPFKLHLQMADILENTDVERVSEIADRLEAYQTADPQFVEALHQFAQLNQETVDDLLDATGMISTTFDPTVRQDQLHIMLATMRISGSTVAERVQRITNEWTEPSQTGSAKQFTEVSEHYVE
jgi:hypothetical protein